MSTAETLRQARVQEVFGGQLRILQMRTDRLFAWLFIGQWLFGIGCAIAVSPDNWQAAARSSHSNVSTAVLVGAAIISGPLLLIFTTAHSRVTMYAVSAAQLLYSELLIHLTGGRTETYVHAFASLAILAFYRDVTVFLPGLAVVIVRHSLGGIFWPQSVYGVAAPLPWRELEHTGWILFETSFMAWGIAQSRGTVWRLAELQVSLSDERDQLENRIDRRVAELSAQRRLLQDVINNIPGGVFWKDREFRFLGCNEFFAKAVGFDSPSDVIGKRDEDLPWASENIESYRECDRQVMQTCVPLLNIEEMSGSRNGSPRTLLTSKVPLFNAAGVPIGVIGLFQDITEKKQLEAQLSQAHKLESIGQLAAGIAHEINTPMQCVCGNVEFLKSCYAQIFQVIATFRAQLNGPKLDWRQRGAQIDALLQSFDLNIVEREIPAAIDESVDAVKRVIEIVRAMKAMSHPGTKAKVSTNVNELIRHATAISRNKWKYVAEVELQLEEPLPDIHALPAELSQVFLNLIVNAADAVTEKLGESPQQLGKITIHTASRNNGVQIDVHDTGCGIRADVCYRVFDPFFTTKEVGKGTGQGLALAYDLIVNKHQGRITVDPGLNDGATFSVWLPCKTNSSPSREPGPDEVPRHPASSNSHTSSHIPAELTACI